MNVGDKIYGFVNQQIALLDRDTSESKAMLGRLRSAVGKSPCDTPQVWGITLSDDLQCEYQGKVTEQGLAVHTALTLYALHKQGTSRSMNTHGVSMGKALAELVNKGVRKETVEKKFSKVVLAKKLNLMACHARRLIVLLKRNELGFDYASFAKDLYRYQYTEGFAEVRLRWGSDFYKNINRDGGSK